MTPIALADPSSELVAAAGGACETGTHRENNEDYLLVAADPPVCLVLDGMGGHAAGERASRTAGDTILAALRRGTRSCAGPQEIIEKAVRRGHERVRELGCSDPCLRGCGTTVVLALLFRGRVFVTWVGDSIAYRVSAGKIERLTRPHDMKHALVEAGVLTEAEARDGRVCGGLIRHLGSKDYQTELDVPSFVPRPGDRVILATDGVTGVLDDAQLLAACREVAEPQACADHLVRLALDRGSRDNCTCAVIAFPGEVAAPPRPRKWWQLWR